MSPSINPLANPFQFTDLDVSTAIDENNNGWFCAKDVCKVLDITWNGSTLENMPEEWKGVLKLRTPSAENGRGGGEQNAIFINEPGLYRLIFRSNKPKAIEFSNWVFEEVLPAIRKTGFYGKVAFKDHLAIIKHISQLTNQIINSKNAFEHQTLIPQLRNLHNMVGSKMPAIELISKQLDQLDLFDGGSV